MTRKFIVVAILLLAGCAETPQVRTERPHWVTAPAPAVGQDEFIYAVGVANPEPDQAAMERKAQHHARAELAKAVVTYVREVMVQFIESHTRYGSPSDAVWSDFTGLVSSEVSSAFLRQSMRYESWRDPSDGALYVLYRMPTSVVHDRINERAAAALREVNPFGEWEKEALAQMDEFLRNRLKQTLTAVAATQEPEAPIRREYPVPQWLTESRQGDYPPEQFMTAVGLGEDREAAAKAARVELANQIDVHVTNEFTSLVESENQDGLTRNLRWVREKTVTFTEGDLVASRTARTWYDPVTKTHYALGVLVRAVAAAACKEKIQSALEQADALMGSARNHHDADNYEMALQEYLEALGHVQQAVKAQLTAMVVQPAQAEKFALLIDKAVLVELKTSVRGLLQEIHLEKIAGDNQWVPPGTALKIPLKVRVTAGKEKKALSNLPVRFRFKIGRGTLQGTVMTEPDGMAICTACMPERSPEPAGVVAAGLDLERMAPGVDLSHITAPQVEFVYVLRSKANSVLALYIDERTLDGEPAQEPVLLDALEAALAGDGFNVVARSEIARYVAEHAVGTQASEADVLGAFEPLRESLKQKGFLLVAVGRADAEIIETIKTSAGDLHIAHAPVALRVMDASLPEQKKRTVLAINIVGKDAFTDNKAEAARRARLDAARRCADELVQKLNERFGEK